MTDTKERFNMEQLNIAADVMLDLYIDKKITQKQYEKLKDLIGYKLFKLYQLEFADLSEVSASTIDEMRKETFLNGEN